MAGRRRWWWLAADLPFMLLLTAGCVTSETASSPSLISDRDALIAAISQKLTSSFIYPEFAKQAGWEGWVVVEATIRKDGTLERAEVHRHSGCTLLIRDAIEQVEKIFPIPSKISVFPWEDDLAFNIPVHYLGVIIHQLRNKPTLFSRTLPTS